MGSAKEGVAFVICVLLFGVIVGVQISNGVWNF